MKKIIFSLLAIVSVAAVVGVGSYALWSSVKTSDNNYFMAGSLDLEFSDGIDGDWTDQLPNELLQLEDVYPGDSDNGDIGWVRNSGTVDGTMKAKLANIRNEENGRIDPEIAYGDTSPNIGELCQYVEVQVTFDVYGTLITSDWKNVNTAPEWNFGGNAGLDAEEAVVMAAAYRVSSDAPNNTMTDKCLFDIVVTLDQDM